MGYRKNAIIGIYTITNTVNGLKYVGGTINVKRRWQQHRKSLKNNAHRSIYLQTDYNLYGESVFEFKIIENLNDKSEIPIREQYWYDYYEPFKRENGYNVNLNAKDWTGRKHFPEAVAKIRKAKENVSEETKRKISVSCKGRVSAFKGHKHTQETKDLFRLQKIGKKLSQEHCEKLSISKKGINRGMSNNQAKYSDELIVQAYELSFNGIPSVNISTELNINMNYLREVLRGMSRKILYNEYALPRMQNGESLTLKWIKK